MLDIQVTIQGDKVLIEGLNKFILEIPHAVKRALERFGEGIDRESSEFLKGSGAKGRSIEVTSKKTGKKYFKWEKQTISAGGYPVPVRTGHLRRSLDWLKPGKTKSMTRHGEKHDIGSFTAGPNEVVIYNAAIYANVIHEGKGSSAKYGPRRYLTDALERFNQGAKIKRIMEEEIRKAKGKL